ncbi:hypothetical protein HEP87_50995 [Streptomyces sp. S1D4-11]|nr:hypothetical protein [Streptomyces sp. S1D4-11]
MAQGLGCDGGRHFLDQGADRGEPRRQILGPRRPTGRVLRKLGGGRGSGRGVVHAPDCTKAPSGAPVLTLERALDTAQRSPSVSGRRAQP